MAPRHSKTSIDQAAIIGFLRKPTSYDPNPKSVDVIETHGAMVFLVGDHVFKIKRAVKFDYMDFSTLEKRRKICERELALNKPSAPALYIDVIPITQEADGTLAVNGDGKPVEWAIHMHRFDQASLFTALARTHKIGRFEIKHLATEVALYHEGAAVSPDPDGAGRIEAIIEELHDAFQTLTGIIDGTQVANFTESVKSHLLRHAPVLNDRAHRGLVRRCHGDLHLGNIVQVDSKPVLFDALEFDETLATTDLLYEIAFLVMDLWHEGLRAEANLLLNRYLYETSDLDQLDGLRVLPLFMAIRAGIRAMVSAQRAAQVDEGDRSTCPEAGQFLGDALRFLAPPPARLVAVGGYSGSGKSTLAAEIAVHIGAVPGAVHIRSDLERKVLFGVGETVRLDDALYTAEASTKVYGAMMAKAATALSAEHSVIADAVFSDQSQRREIESVAQRLGVPFTGLWLTAPQDDLMERVSTRRGDASDATAETVRVQLSKGEATTSWHEIDASGSPLETVIAAQLVLRHDHALTFDDEYENSRAVN